MKQMKKHKPHSKDRQTGFSELVSDKNWLATAQDQVCNNVRRNPVELQERVILAVGLVRMVLFIASLCIFQTNVHM